MELRPLNPFMLTILVSLSALIAGCDTRDPFKPKTETAQIDHEPRTMIIGGVPVHDRDYKLNETLLVEDVHLTK